MPSIPAALTWELFDRSRWSLPAAALGALAFPVLVLSALSSEGAFFPHDRSMLIMQIVMMMMNITTFSIPLTAGVWKISRLYAYPASAATLVTWRLLPAMVAMFVESVAWTATLNAMFPLDWPLWGPALFSAVALAAALSAIWLTTGSRWVIFALTVVGVVLGLWFKLPFGGAFSVPLHQWTTATPTEIFTLLAIAGLAWRVAIVGVARNRRGEPPFSLGVVARIERLFQRAPAARSAFRSPARAQFWFQWRNGWLAPGVAVAALSFGLIIWAFNSRDPQDLVAGVVAGAGVVMCATFIGGIVIGDLSPGRDTAMGQFLATRPMTPAAHARTILRAAAASLLLAWAVWALAATLAYGICAALGAWPSPLIPKDQDWRQIPAAFVGSWICMSNMTSIILAGRPAGFVRIVIGVMVAYFIASFTAKFALAPEIQQQVLFTAVTASGIACLLGTVAAFVAALRRGLVEAPTAWTALAVWAALVVAAVLALPPVPNPSASYVLLIGFLALAVAPLAAAPLALAWNRHR